MIFAMLFTGCCLVLIGYIGEKLGNEYLREFGECFGYASFCCGIILGLMEVGKALF